MHDLILSSASLDNPYPVPINVAGSIVQLGRIESLAISYHPFFVHDHPDGIRKLQPLQGGMALDAKGDGEKFGVGNYGLVIVCFEEHCLIIARHSPQSKSSSAAGPLDKLAIHVYGLCVFASVL